MMLNVGIIGTGWFSGIHAKILTKMDGVQIKAICGTSKEKAEKFALEFNDVKGYSSVVDMLDSEKLDAVYICVPPFAHGDIEIELLNREIPFLVEKPLGVNLEIPTDILSKLQDHSLITSVGYHFRYRDSIALLKKELESSTLGIVTGGWMGSMPLVPWWRNQNTSGGQFIEQTTHLVDLLRYTVGEVQEVYSSFGNRSLSKQHENVSVHDVGTVTLKFNNGVIANLSNTCILPEGDSKVGIDFYTNKGMLHVGFEGLDISKKGTTSTFRDTSNPYEKENLAFIHAVKTGDCSMILSDYQDAYKTHHVTVAAGHSSEKGIPIILNEYLA
ncbi:Gfo/Idh/MocA family protein [Metabacillus schmidteae]|uniref:Gfo/Idh/MocA family protein n=1 Tax=Metabacillus schmidteae TaxID=2730405 RepID=UPI00158AC926|nr:Gfo/Idh/MocA family oxidoreductase [Metabacillus schmidteae]